MKNLYSELGDFRNELVNGIMGVIGEKLDSICDIDDYATRYIVESSIKNILFKIDRLIFEENDDLSLSFEELKVGDKVFAPEEVHYMMDGTYVLITDIDRKNRIVRYKYDKGEFGCITCYSYSRYKAGRFYKTLNLYMKDMGWD